MGQLVLQFGQSTPKTTPNFACAGACCLASEMRQNRTILQPLREGSTLHGFYCAKRRSVTFGRLQFGNRN